MNILSPDSLHAEFVNLDHRTDRRIGMVRELKRVGITAGRRRGMLPSEWKGDPARIKGMWDRPQKGAIGCHFSQIAVMQEALRHRKHALVMEDDLAFCSDFQERLKIIDGFLSCHDWDIFWLGATFHVNPPHWHINHSRGCRPLGRDAAKTDHPRIFRTFGCFCTYAYIVNGEAIEKVFRMMETRLPQSIGIDHLMIMLQPDLRTFAFVPGCVKQYDHISDIGVDGRGNPAQTTFSSFAKLGPYWWADNMNEFDPERFNWHEVGR